MIPPQERGNFSLVKGAPAPDRVGGDGDEKGSQMCQYMLTREISIPISLLPTPIKWLCNVSAAWTSSNLNGKLKKGFFLSHLPASKRENCTFCLPASSLSSPSSPLCVSPSLTAFFPGWGVHGPSGSAAFVSDLEQRELSELSVLEWEGRGRGAVDGTQSGSSQLLWRRHQDTQLKIIPQVMTRQHLSLLTPLALLGLLMGLAELSHGSAGEDEDYYMQDLLTREQYNQVQMLEKPVASIPDRHDHPSQNSDRKVPKGKADNSRQMDKTTADAKSGKSTVIF